jgi:hypothetical protein
MLTYEEIVRMQELSKRNKQSKIRLWMIVQNFYARHSRHIIATNMIDTQTIVVLKYMCAECNERLVLIETKQPI